MSWNILQATKRLAFVGKLFTTAKLDLDAMIDAGDETALAAHLEQAGKGSAAPAAPAPAAITAEHPEVAALISAAVAPLKFQLAAVDEALAAVGIKGASTAEPEAMAKSFEDRIAIKAAEELAKKGVTSFAATEANPDPTKPAPAPKAANLSGRERYRAAFQAQFARN